MLKFTLTAIFLAVINLSLAGTVTVTNTNNSGIGSLRDAVSIANAGDTIRFSPSLIAGGSNLVNLTSNIIINKALTIKGLYNSTDTLYITNTTNIFGALVEIDVTSQTLQKFVFDSICFKNTINLALYYKGKDFTLSNSTIRGCKGSLFMGNFSDTVKGLIKKSIFINNKSAVGVEHFFGSLYFNVYLNVDSCDFISNKGGVNVKNYRGDNYLNVSNSNFIDNVKSNPDEGGAIYNYSTQGKANTFINNSTFLRNKAAQGGAISSGLCRYVDIEIQSSTFLENNTQGPGGVIFCANSSFPASNSVKIENSTLHKNKASTGGAIYLSLYLYSPTTVDLDIINSTIVGNDGTARSNLYGSQIFIQGFTSTIDIKGSVYNSKFKESFYAFGPRLTSVTFTSGGYNMFSDSVASFRFMQPYLDTTDMTFSDSLTLKLNHYYRVNKSLISLIPDSGSILINKGNPIELNDAQNRSKIGIRDIGAVEFNCQLRRIDSINTCAKSVIWKGLSYNKSGIYTGYFQNNNGCDSVGLLYLNLIETDTISISNGVLMKVNTIPANFQWLDCNNGYSIIAGETNQTYRATLNGNYAVEITKNGCVDTTACVMINSVGLNENNNFNHINLFPNPTNGTFTLDLGEQISLNRIFITDINGRLIKEIKPQNVAQYEVNFEGAPGIYLLNVIGENERTTLKIIKE